jgi:hypothetical protein
MADAKRHLRGRAGVNITEIVMKKCSAIPAAARKQLLRGCVAGACFAAALAAPIASAEESTVSKDAKQVGHAIGETARDIGHAAKKAGQEIGHDAARAGKEVGPAAKEAGHEIGSGFSELGHKIGHAAKQGWEAVVEFFHGKN